MPPKAKKGAEKVSSVRKDDKKAHAVAAKSSKPTGAPAVAVAAKSSKPTAAAVLEGSYSSVFPELTGIP